MLKCQKVLGSYTLKTSRGNFKTKDVRILEINDDGTQSINWSVDGCLLASTNKHKKLRIWDRRTPVATGELPVNHGSRVTWIKQPQQLATSLLTKNNIRMISLFDIRKLPFELMSIELGESNTPLVINSDPDTGMVFAYAKGDRNIQYFEMLDSKIIQRSIYKGI